MKKRCWTLFTTMLFLSAFTFGGGFVIIPLMQRRFTRELEWLTEDEVLEMVAFARASPGAVTVNVAVQVGFRAAGIAGALCGVLGTIIPPLAILSALSLCYSVLSTSLAAAALLYGLRVAVAVAVSNAVAAMVAEAVRGGERLRWAVSGAVFLLSLAAGMDTVWLLMGSAVLGWLVSGRRAA